MTKYDELIGKLGLLIKSLEKKYEEENKKYQEKIVEEENLKDEIIEQLKVYDKNDDAIAILTCEEEITSKWYKKNWWKLVPVGIIMGTIIRFGFELNIFYSICTTIIGCIFIGEKWRIKDNAKEQCIFNEYEINKTLKDTEKLEKTIAKKVDKVEELELTIEMLNHKCEELMSEITKNKTLLAEIMGSRNLAFSLTDGNHEKIDKIFDSDERSKNTMSLIRERIYIENN